MSISTNLIEEYESQLAALREELAVANRRIDELLDAGEKVLDSDEQRLADAERRNEGLTSDLLDRSAELNAMQRQRDQIKDQLRRECDDMDAALKILNLDPEHFRTDGGFLNLSKFRELAALNPKPEAASHDE